MEKPNLQQFAIVPIGQLKNWDKNPRAIREEDFARLKLQILRHRQYKPLVVNDGTKWGERGVVLGGNMRLRAHTELGTPDLLVSWVSPENELEAIEVALSDNEQHGYYEEQQLAEIMLSVPDFPMDDYRISLADMVHIDTLLDRFRPTDTLPETDQDTLATDQLNTWANSTIRQIVLFFNVQEFESTMKRLEALQGKLGTANNTETVLKLIEYYENNNS